MLPLLILLAAPAQPLGPPPDAGVAPTAREMAQLFFLAGDLRRAVDSAKRCIQVEGRKKCEPLYRALVEYEALIRKNEELTPAEAKSYLEWDRFISPKEPGKLTRPVLRRWVEEPLQSARIVMQAGDKKAAKTAIEKVLQIDPKNGDAKRLLEEVQ